MNVNLTDQEKRVLEHLAKGLGNESIGKILDIVPGTVQNHVKAIYDKVGVRNRAGLTRWAIKEGLVKV